MTKNKPELLHTLTVNCKCGAKTFELQLFIDVEKDTDGVIMRCPKCGNNVFKSKLGERLKDLV
jgi:hypothetical protein